MREDDRRQLAEAARVVDSLRTAPAVTDAGAVALGYLERLRVGVAAPFRLLEQASVDPRLPVELRDRVAWALVDQVRRGDAFVVDSTALGDGPDAPPTVLVDGGWHRAFIDSLVRAAPAARTGEETVRLTYALARAEWLVTPQTAVAAVNAAALARDRRLAQSDVERLLAAPLSETDSTRLLLARSWRIARLFASERPLLADDLAPDHTRAVQDAARALDVLRSATLAPTLPTVASAPPDTSAAGITRATFPLDAAARLSALPSVRLGFPSAPIVVSLGGFHRDLGVVPGHTPTNSELLRTRLLARARTDEALVAEWTLVRAALPAGDVERQQLARAVEAAAVAARADAQAAPAFATATATQDGRTAVAALKWRDGVRDVSVDANIPPTWGLHVANTVSAATANLRRVLPELALDGLSLRVGDSPQHDLALALHDPARRTVYLPPLTSAGTLAHELAHDLDWQTARGRLGVRGVYATDRATRVDLAANRTPPHRRWMIGADGARDTAGLRTLADAVRVMAGVHTTLPPGASGSALGAPPPGRRGDEDRPAELFARGVDFFVAVALARQGRSDATLTAVQDPLLVGYAGVRAPDPGDGTAEALVDVLAGMTLVPSTAREWYLARFGREGTRTPLAVVGDVLRAAPVWDAEGILRAVGVPGGLTTGAGTVWPNAGGTRGESCRTGPGGGAPAPWQGHLLWLTADARARGLVRARALRAAAAGGAWWGWSAQPLLGGPWRTELASPPVNRLRDAILRAAAVDRDRRLPFAGTGGGCPW
ncbi:hypothetical protein tb265_13940 [Gemmatimonadetes bacterium T265]|nr:hypothetical protein tb265_13940 [Gemmatimonadetes bacterium T265]